MSTITISGNTNDTNLVLDSASATISDGAAAAASTLKEMKLQEIELFRNDSNYITWANPTAKLKSGKVSTDLNAIPINHFTINDHFVLSYWFCNSSTGQIIEVLVYKKSGVELSGNDVSSFAHTANLTANTSLPGHLGVTTLPVIDWSNPDSLNTQFLQINKSSLANQLFSSSSSPASELNVQPIETLVTKDFALVMGAYNL